MDSRQRRARHMELAAQAIMVGVGAIGVAIAFHSIVLAF